jgi:hypothetical protein
MPGGRQLRGENVTNHAFPVNDVGHPTREEAEGTRNTVQTPYLPLRIAQEGERKIMVVGEVFV